MTHVSCRSINALKNEIDICVEHTQQACDIFVMQFCVEL